MKFQDNPQDDVAIKPIRLTVQLSHAEVRMWEILRTNLLWASKNYEMYLGELRAKYGFDETDWTSLNAENRTLTIRRTVHESNTTEANTPEANARRKPQG